MSNGLGRSWRVLRAVLGVPLLFASTAPTAWAQDSTFVRLVGEVRDLDTERPVADIAVKVEG